VQEWMQVNAPHSDGAVAYAIAAPDREMRLRPARRIELLAHLAGAFDLAEQQAPGHAARVAYLAYQVGAELGVEDEALRRILYAGLLHDSGVAVRTESGHVDSGAWVAHCFGLDDAVQEAIQATHERWDGRGRPHGLVGTEIPVEALCVNAAHWATEFADQEPNPLRARWLLQHAPAGSIEVLVGPKVAEALIEVLRNDHTWLSLWDDGLATLLARAGAGDERPSRGQVEAVAEAMGTVIDSAVREPGRAARISLLARALAELRSLRDSTCQSIGVAGYLLDIGQLGVPRHVTDKPSILTVDEMEMMRRHPGMGARIIEYAPALGDLAPWIEQHHERPDGRGYPEMLELDELPLPPRILAVADAYWALRAERPYRPAFSEQDALEMVLSGADQQFDAGTVAVLPDALEAIRPALEESNLLITS
jgi:HD-GYP domain-containing protein (c-di-GMP phosphodiesterase class II)